MEDGLKTWCSDKLSQLMGNCFLPDGDLVRYILDIPSPRDLEEFLKDLFGDDKKDVYRGFIKELQQERMKGNGTNKPNVVSRNIPGDTDEQKAVDFMSNPVPPQPSIEVKHSARGSQPLLEMAPSHSSQLASTVSPFKKKQLRYVPLHSRDGKSETIILPGRHACECLGQKHGLINNCTECGRIVCEQEGSGPCFFCGNLVCSQDEREILVRNSKKSAKLMEKLMQNLPAKEDDIAQDKSSGKGAKARAHKEKLLEYDRTSARRTKVIDDEADYFSSSSKWLSAESRKKLTEREDELLNKKHAKRKGLKVNIDFAGRTVTEAKEDMNVYDPENDDVVKSIHQSSAAKPGSDTMAVSTVDPRIKGPRPQFVSDHQTTEVPIQVMSNRELPLRVQDKEFLEMQDDGMCLSMHQPWASLLVCGIKTVEGRSWYSSHRGRLWIAAAAKEPSADEIATVEQQYMSTEAGVDFPNDYPTGVLLGCVAVSDCLKNEDYRSKFPQSAEETDSSFVFICQNPKELLIKIPMKGQHKIWKLDAAIHHAVRRSLIATA